MSECAEERGPRAPLLRRRCWECPFDARMSVRQRTELMDGYDLETHRFDNGEEMYCHMSGPGGTGGEYELHRCRGFHNLAERHRREGGGAGMSPLQGSNVGASGSQGSRPGLEAVAPSALDGERREEQADV